MKTDKSYKEILQDITTFIFDVDGVLTDGSVTLMPDGSQIRKMSTRDGYALQLAVKKGFNVIIISGGKDERVKTRLNGLGIKMVYLGVSDKVDKYENLLIENQITKDQVVYMGDDMPDYDIMQLVGLATCPKDACSDIREISDYISPFNGGEGCARDILEQTMKIQKKWLSADGSEIRSI
ncbi:MAG: HAD hydrolase family protein [Ichthyobacteriaceae bacterium]|nr:HAD hydrolase family protein [Ichthyobacteriaceae bacterium]